MKSELLTIDKKTELLKAITEKAFEDILAQTKSANPKDVGIFKMIISDNTMDRQGDMVDQNGFDIENYMKHPVVLWGHDYFSLPIGITDKVYREDNKTIAEGRFAPTDEAQKIRKYYDAGYPVAASVGYIPKDSIEGKVMAAELLEWSFVTVPANANCISADEARVHGLDIEFLTTKGFKFEEAKVKEEEKEEGSGCELEDGTPGIMAKDPDNPDGALICVLEKSEDKKDEEKQVKDTNQNKEKMDVKIANKLQEIQEHSKAIDEHIKAQQSVISEMLSPGNNGEGGEKEKPSEQKSEASGIQEMTLDDAIKAGNIVKECLRIAVTKAAEALKGFNNAEKRLPVKK